MVEIVNKRIKLQSFSNRIAPIFSLAVALFGWYKVLIEGQGGFFLILAIIFSVACIVPFAMKAKSAELKLYPDEKIIKDYRAVTWSGSTAMSWQTAWTKNVGLTDRRVALSSNFFGVETYKGALSVFYNEADFQKYKGITSCMLKDVYTKDDAVFIVAKSRTQPMNFTWKLKEDKDFIYQTILKYHSK